MSLLYIDGLMNGEVPKSFLAYALSATQAHTGLHDVVIKTLLCYLHLDATALLLLIEIYW